MTRGGSPEVNLFVLSTGFHYYYSTLLVYYLGLENVVYAMYQPREGIELKAAERFRVAHAGRDDKVTRLFGKKAGKWFFARRAFDELGLAGRPVRVITPYYNESFVYALRRHLERGSASVVYDMLPDGAALLRNLPGKRRGSAASWLARALYGVEPADVRHKSGSFSSFVRAVYHFPAARIQADPSKLHIVPAPAGNMTSTGEVLVLGGLRGISRGFVREAARRAAGRPVRFRMHPKVRKGVEYIAAEAPDWRELELDGVLEEHLLAHPYDLVIGHYSSAVVFNHLFVTASRSEFVVDAASEDHDYHQTAESCGIPVTVL